MPRFDSSHSPRDDHYVTPRQYGLAQPPSQQKLTPLDMNMPRLYGARWILCFPLPTGTSNDQVYENLKEGLAHTISSIPWIAGKVGPEEGQDPKHNRIQIIDSSSRVKFPYQDLTGLLPPYTELKKGHFPLSRLLTSQLGPMAALPEGPEQPVMAAQANFIQGGLLLAVGVHHSVCDASALDVIVNTWAQNTAAASGSSKSFTTHDAQSNDRSPLMKGMQGADIVDFPEYTLLPLLPAHGGTPAMAFEMPPLAARIFFFSPESLAHLKAAAAAFSTNDALCAFIWQRMTLARTRSGVIADPTGGEVTSVLAYAVNIRNRMSPPLPSTFLGNASMASVTKRLAVSTLTSDNALPQVAAAIRQSLSAFNSPCRVPLTIGLLNSRPDPTDFNLSYNAFLGPDVVTSSWADLRVYESDWGGTLGTVDSLRMPGEGADGVFMVLPRLKDGGLEVSIGLRLEAMEKLLEDDEFNKVAQPWQHVHL